MNKLECQQRYIKKKQTEILELKNSTSKNKNSLQGLNIGLDQAEESVNSNTGNFKLPNQRKKEKKRTKNDEVHPRDELLGGHHQADQYKG